MTYRAGAECDVEIAKERSTRHARHKAFVARIELSKIGRKSLSGHTLHHSERIEQSTSKEPRRNGAGAECDAESGKERDTRDTRHRVVVVGMEFGGWEE